MTKDQKLYLSYSAFAGKSKTQYCKVKVYDSLKQRISYEFDLDQSSLHTMG